ncbi:MAG: hypothetical protein FWG11_07025, partial [Promicromonosporaceae bacterium]|nr:hypothetical protein [Promicromonosporaceae bacterium]
EKALGIKDKKSDGSGDSSHIKTILLSHPPAIRHEAAAAGVDIVLSGHTHGGQLCVPGIGALVTNCDLDRRRASGLSGWPGARPNAPHGRGTDSVWLHVSGGAGTSPYAPVRFACRPAATLLTLVASDWAAGGSFAG